MSSETMSVVDVRGVPPRDRLGIILGAWDALAAGAGMHLWVDHDPRCMYYTIRAMHGEDSLQFDYLQEGPEDWQVQVVKRRA